MMLPIIIIALLVVMLVGLSLFFMQGYTRKSKPLLSSTVVSNAPADSTGANSAAPGLASSTEPRNQQSFLGRSSSGPIVNNNVTRAPGGIRATGATQGALPVYNNAQSSPGFASTPPVLQEMSPLSSRPSSKPVHAQRKYELEQEYERGMYTVYDENIDAINFISMHVVMNTPDEVDLAFRVCKRQIRTVLRSKGLERAPTLTDIGGLIIGRDATAAWGQALKDYLEEMCIKVGKDTYLLAHYNSQAIRPEQDQLQEKLKRIQFMTAAAINNFQSNIFDTREEATAFLQRMREVYRV